MVELDAVDSSVEIDEIDTYEMACPATVPAQYGRGPAATCVQQYVSPLGGVCRPPVRTALGMIALEVAVFQPVGKRAHGHRQLHMLSRLGVHSTYAAAVRAQVASRRSARRFAFRSHGPKRGS